MRQVFFGPKTITAYFPTATSIYPGDEVRVSGVKVGTIDSITPEGTQAKMTLKVDRDVPVPADAKAVIVAQNLVAARYVQLTPAYRNGGGPTMGDGAVIPERPHRGPRRMGRGQDPVDAPGNRTGTARAERVGHLGLPIHRQRRERAGTATATSCARRWRNCPASARVFAEGSGNIVDIIKNLQIFVTALRDSKEQIVLFQNRLATPDQRRRTTAGPISTRR